MEGGDKDEEDRNSIYSTLDELWRGRLRPKDVPPLEVVVDDGKLWSLSNRRLVVFKLLQATSQHQTVWVPCVKNGLGTGEDILAAVLAVGLLLKLAWT